MGFVPTVEAQAEASLVRRWVQHHGRAWCIALNVVALALRAARLEPHEINHWA